MFDSSLCQGTADRQHLCEELLCARLLCAIVLLVQCKRETKLGFERSEVVGHAVISVTAGESHMLNLSIAGKHQRKGYGSRFIEFLVGEARNRDAHTMLLEVRPSNTAAINCYNAAGFNEIGSRKDYYPAPGGREDALLFARHIPPVAESLSG